MVKHVKRQWLQALRNGKSKQIKYYLHTKDGYDALGVLVSIYLRDKNLKWEKVEGESYSTPYYKFNEYYVALPPEVARWAQVSPKQATQIAVMNDMRGKTFEEIADYIEINF